jgi:hypothetical protein
VQLEGILSPEELTTIDAMPSENDMSQYHFGLGVDIRNDWGLWQGSPLAKHMRELGFTDPDIMSGVILKTFWCKRHGQDFRLEERAAAFKKSTEIVQKDREEEETRIQKTKVAITNRMIGLRIQDRDAPPVRVPISNGLSVRFMCPFRSGVFLTACCQWPSRCGAILSDGYYADPVSGEAQRRAEMDDSVMRGLYLGVDHESDKTKQVDDFYTLGFYLDLEGREIHRIRVEEVNEVYAAVVAAERAWFAGLTNGKTTLVGVGERDRITMALPREDEIPDLGIDGPSLLAVYSKTIYRLTDREWTLVHSGDILLPRSGLPPHQHGNMVFLRDEGRNGMGKRLWWLTMGEQSHLSVFDHDVGVVGPGGPHWENSLSYCVTSNGDLWACVGEVSAAKSVLRRSKDGSYSVAIMNNSARFTGDLVGSGDADQGVPVSAVTGLSDDTLLLAGDRGLYRLEGNELAQELAFVAEDSSGRVVPCKEWNPSNVLLLYDGSYVISSGSGYGVYLLRKGNDGQWSFLSLNEKLGDPVVW